MKLINYLVFACLTFTLALGSCTSKEKEKEAPAMPPEKVVLKFYSLLGQGGKLTLKEAHGMVSQKYGHVDPDSFRKWVQDFEKGTKIKIVDVDVPKERNKGGVYVASVRMEVATPSLFGDAFISTSRMNLVLDEELNEWKIDFLAETNKYENDYKNEPLEAKADSGP